MTAQFIYEAGLQATSEDITDRVRLYTLDVTQNAEEGSVALSTITIDDPDGDYEIKGFRRLRIVETAMASNSLMANLWIVDRKIVRGPYKTQAGRQWVCSVADMNSVPEFRIFHGTTANRPAETDVARIQWLMTTSELGSRVTNSQYINTSGAVPMDAVDYRGQKPSDVINDCAQQSGKNYFTYTIEPTPYFLGLWYDFADSSAYTSDIRLTNDLADVVADPYGLTYLIADDTELERDPSRVYSGAFVQYDGGTVYREDLGISNEFTRRDAVVAADNVKTYNKALARGDRYLSAFDTEEDRITTAIRLPAEKVNFVREGMRVRFRATHLPGYEGPYSWLRVLKRTIKQDSEVEYLVTLELGTGPSTPSSGAQPAGAATMYGWADNDVDWYINGTFIGNNSAGDNNFQRPVPGGVIVAGDNVLAARITNGVEPATGFNDNPTYLENSLYPASGGTPWTFTSTSAKTWDVSNTPSGTLGGPPANWNEASFDDSGWANAIDVTDHAALAGVFERAPARLIAPAGAIVGNYDRGLVWLCRMNFTAS
jgi:hypothetical protein